MHMLKTLLRVSARNALRNRARTGLTAGMVVLGVALLIVGMAWVDGVFGQMMGTATRIAGHVRVVTPGFAAKEKLMPLYENMAEVEPIVAALRDTPELTGVYPRITTGVTVSAGDEIGEWFAQAVGAPVAYFDEQLGGAQDLIEGEWFSGDEDQFVIGSKVAEQTGAKVGGELILLGMTQDGSMSPVKGTVVGILGQSNIFAQRQVWMPLSKMQWLADMDGGATEVVMYFESHLDAERLEPIVAANPALKDLTVQAWMHRDPWAEMWEQADVIAGALVFFILFLTALGIWNTMMMSVLERTHEIGVMRAMGMTRAGTLALFVVEALAIAVVGGALGVALGSIPAWLLETRGIHLGAEVTSKMSDVMPISETMHGDLTLQAVVMGFGLGLVMALMGSLIPALRASTIQPVEAMRSNH